MAKTLAEFGCKVDVCDPWADPDEVKRNYELSSFRSLEAEDPAQYEAVVLAVAHDEFRRIDPRTFRKNSCVIYDIKGLWPRELVDGRL